MKKYSRIFMNSVSVQLTYKFNLLTGLLNNMLGVLISALTWIAIYESTVSDIIGGFTRYQMLFYIIIVNFSMALFSTGGVVKLGTQVRLGKLTTHLLRPYSLLGRAFAEFLGERFMYVTLYGLVLLGALFLGYNPYYILHLVLFLISNVLMFFMVTQLIGNLGFWMVQMWPFRGVVNALYTLLGGMLFPLSLLPETMSAIVSKNPFALVGYQYTLALQHELSIQEIQTNILWCLMWFTVCYIGYTVSFKRGLLRYEGMGA